MPGGGSERFLSLDNKICKKNKGDWTSVEKKLNFLIKSISHFNLLTHECHK
jgi:hypothetical protein